MFETLTMLAIVVEAAGGLERAIRLGKLVDNDPEQEKQLYETVPKSRGGQNDHEDAESLWQTILDDALEDPQGRATFNQLRTEVDNIELAQARCEIQEPGNKNMIIFCKGNALPLSPQCPGPLG